MLAIGGSAQAINDLRDLFQVSEIKRHVRSDRKAYSMGVERNAADKIKYLGPLRRATVDAVIHGDLQDVEVLEIGARPLGDWCAITNPH